MSEFHSKPISASRVHGYPDARGGGAALQNLARNYASGPAGTDPTSIAAGGGTQVPWDVIDSGAPPGVHVPVTPKVTGIVLVQAVLSLKNNSNDPARDGSVQVFVQVNDVSVPIPNIEQMTLNIGAFDALPVQVEVTLTTGVASNISILLIASDPNTISLVGESSTINIQEVLPATG